MIDRRNAPPCQFYFPIILIAAVCFFIQKGVSQSAAAGVSAVSPRQPQPCHSADAQLSGNSGPGSDTNENFVTDDARYITVEKYAVRLELFPDKHMVSGEVDIYPPAGALFSGEVVLKLHEDMAVRTLETLYAGVRRPVVRHSRFHDTIAFSINQPAEAISISFYGDPSRYVTPKNSFTYIGEEGCYFDDLCAYFPRAGFEQRSFFELSVTHRGLWTPITQGEAAGSETLADGRVTTRFVNRKKSRCHTLAAGPYKKITAGGRGASEVTAFFFANDSHLAPAHLSEAGAILDFYRSRYGDNGIKKLNLVEVEKVFPGGYGPEEIVYLTASAITENAIDRELLAHEIAHQWFGNFVMGKFPESNFLNEAFATYAALEYIREKYPEDYRKKYDEMARDYLAYRTQSAPAEISIDEAARNPRPGGAWQAVLYYRGMMALRATLSLLEKAAGMKPAEIISGYLSNFAEKTVTIDEFIRYALNEKSALYSRAAFLDEKAFRMAAAAFNGFYFTTAAVELEVKSATVSGAGESSGIGARIVIERTDTLELEFETAASIYAVPENTPKAEARLIAKKNFVLRRGKNIVEFNLAPGYLHHRYAIDEDNDLLVAYKSPAFAPCEPGSESVAIYACPPETPAKFGEFCRELASGAGYGVVSDEQFNAADFFKYRKVLLIGNFKQSPLARFIAGAFNFACYGERIEIVNCFNGGSFELKEGVSARLVMKNPFIEGGVIEAVLFSGSEALGGYNQLRLYGGDYCVYDTVTRKRRTGCFNYGLCGAFDGNGGVRLLQAGLGVCGHAVSAHPAPLTLQLYNGGEATAEAVLSIEGPGQCFVPEKITMAPGTLTRHETFPLAVRNAGVDLKLSSTDGRFSLRDHIGAAVYFEGIDTVLVGAGGGGEEVKRISGALNHLYAHQFKNRSPAYAASANFSTAPLNPCAYDGFKAVILNNYDLAAAPAGFAETLADYARKGGVVIVSGGGMSEIYSPETAAFMAEYFGVRVLSSVIHYFDETPPGLEMTLLPKGLYGFEPMKWSKALGFNTAGAPAVVIRCRGDNPIPMNPGGAGFFYDERPVAPQKSVRLVHRRFGRGAFYYLPYDFSDEAVKNSAENLHALTKAFEQRPAAAFSNFINESPDAIMFDANERPWPFKLEYFIIFMLLYFSSFLPVYYYADRRRFAADYVFFSGAAAAACFMFLTAVLLRYSVFQTQPIALGVSELVDGRSGPNYELVFYKIWTGGSEPLSVELNGKLVPCNDNLRGFTPTTLSPTRQGCRVETPATLPFYPTIFAAMHPSAALNRNKPISLSASRPPGKNHFTVSIRKGLLKELNFPEPAMFVAQTPGGYFIGRAAETAGAADERGDYVFMDAAATLETILNAVKKKFEISAAHTAALKNLVGSISSREAPEQYLFILGCSNESFGYAAPAAPPQYKKLSVAMAELDFTDEKGSRIPDHFFKKTTVIYGGIKNFRASFISRRYKSLVASNSRDRGLRGLIKFKLSPGAAGDEIKKFCDNFRAFFSQNLIPDSFIHRFSGVRFPAGEVNGVNLINITHDNKKNFVYNIKDGYLYCEIANFGHYLSYDLYDNSGELTCFLRGPVLTDPLLDAGAGFEISAWYE